MNYRPDSEKKIKTDTISFSEIITGQNKWYDELIASNNHHLGSAVTTRVTLFLDIGTSEQKFNLNIAFKSILDHNTYQFPGAWLILGLGWTPVNH